MKKFVLLAAIAAALIVITVLRARLGGEGSADVQTAPLAERTIRASILASGELSYSQQALLSSELIGKVTSIHVDEGDRVERGQLVLEIEDEAYVADVGRQEAQVRSREIGIRRAEVAAKQAEQQWKRNRRMYENRLVSADFFEEQQLAYDLDRLELQSANALLELSREELRKARDSLEKTRILSPMDGVVIAVDIKAGETAIPSAASIPGSELMTIANPDTIFAKVYVDEADVANLRVDDVAEVVATSAPDRPVKGRVERIATSARVAPGRQGLSFAVHITFDTPDPAVLRPGVSCRAEIFVRSRQDVLAVPIQAVRSEEVDNATRQYVFVLRENRAERVEVQTGIADDDYLEITAGVDAGEIIITGPDSVFQTLRSGDYVTAGESDA